MKVLVSGATGTVGRALLPVLEGRGHTVRRLLRGQAAPPDASWDPAAGRIDADALAGCDAVVHLAGESIAEGRWTEAKKARIRDSRVGPTRLLAERLARERQPPALVSASAIGYYGDRGEEILTEDHAGGEGFLPDVCREWEAATGAAQAAGARVVRLRLGVVLAQEGGALPAMLTPFRLGLGGRLGSGRQWFSWIALADVVDVIVRAVEGTDLDGPVNVVAPAPVRNAEFTRVLGKVLGRPTVAALPAFAARLALGEMADALLLASTRVIPMRLAGVGHRLRFPEVEGALQHLLQR
ncbi:MAG: TIGR01777 family oxidoreductase [Vicinamibacteria bacterium]